KLWHFINAGDTIMKALRASRAKITIFLFFVLLMVTIIGSLMYLIEGGVNPGFSSIPLSIYWAIVTLTTVGFGDITPSTELGQFLSAVVMILGYAVIAVPTGIVSAEMVHSQNSTNTQACMNCGREGHDDDATHCKYCGASLYE
ncbi:MAG: ion transporter, partial [Saprospiraceae bacterium]|nr:ion transporter [Saprospiraceae bacterium]